MEQYLPLITGGSGALVVLALWVYAFYSGKIHSQSEFSKLEAENDQLRAALTRLEDAITTERKSVNEAASAGQVTNQLITALASLAAEKTSGRPKASSAPGLTGEDVGL